MSVLQVVDGVVTGRVIVTGSLPPQGRDLDVLAPPATLARSQAALRALGFVPRRSTWARFQPLELVDLRPLADEAMLARATPVEGCTRLCRADPADDLRLTALAFARDGRLSPSRRARAAVPAAVWQVARGRGDGPELDALAAALHRVDDTPGTVRRAAGRVRRVREAGLVALSGVDGAGKSTQATLLRDTLTATGIDAVVEWNRLSHDRWLDAVARPVKWLLGRRTARPEGPAGPSGAPGGERDEPETGPARGVWVVVVAVANAVAHVRSVRRHTLAGRVVICDRYVLDSVVHLESHYPSGPGQRLAVWLVRRLSPEPRAAFYLSVPPQHAIDRKPRPGIEPRVTRQARAYEHRHPALGVARLDATRPVDDLAAEIAAEVWRRL